MEHHSVSWARDFFCSASETNIVMYSFDSSPMQSAENSCKDSLPVRHSGHPQAVPGFKNLEGLLFGIDARFGTNYNIATIAAVTMTM